MVSCPARGTWIEINGYLEEYYQKWSCPARGTWIEMGVAPAQLRSERVVPRKGHVD